MILPSEMPSCRKNLDLSMKIGGTLGVRPPSPPKNNRNLDTRLRLFLYLKTVIWVFLKINWCGEENPPCFYRYISLQSLKSTALFVTMQHRGGCYEEKTYYYDY